jgi:hypothetical protein
LIMIETKDKIRTKPEMTRTGLVRLGARLDIPTSLSKSTR